MVQDRQVRKLHMLKTREETLGAAASKSGMDEKTARKYLRSGKLSSQSKIIPGKRGRILLRMSGKIFGSFWERRRASRPKPFLRTCRGGMRGFCGRPAPDPSAESEALAGVGRAGPGDVLPSDP